MQATNLPKDAVNSIADAQKGFFRLKVNIRGATLNGISKKRVD